MSTTDDYIEQVMKGMNEIHDVLFPPDVVKGFEESSARDIAEGKNLCFPCQLIKDDTLTMHRVFGLGHPAHKEWICKKHANNMWSSGLLHGTIGFDMDEKPGHPD